MRRPDPRFGRGAPSPGSAATSGRTAPKGQRDRRPALYKPGACGVLGLDAAKMSGYALVIPKRSMVKVGAREQLCPYTLLMHGETQHARPELFTEASAACAEHGYPLMIAAEKWQAGDVKRDPRMTPAVIAGLGRAFGRWDMCRELAKVPASRVVRCFTYEWHQVLGTKAPDETWKVRAQSYAYNVFGVELGPDEAEALVMAVWGLHSPRLVDAVPKNRLG